MGMAAGWFRRILVDRLIGWSGVPQGTRARLLQVFCSGIRLRSLVSNTVALVIVAGLIIAETQRASHVIWLATVALSGFLPRLYAARVRRAADYERAPEARALNFVAISAVYGAIWGVGPFLMLPGLSGPAVGVLLVLMIFGTIMGPYAALPGILYVRLATTGVPTLAAIALYTPPTVTLASLVIAAWLVLRTDIWRGYHRALREQLELRESLERRQWDLEQANQAKDEANRSLKVMAETDPLTGVANRRQFMRHLDTVRGPAALIVFDVDRFKRTNDRFGHPTGDAVLVELAARAAENLRKRDLLARLGGDEFAILLPDMDAEGAWNVAERIRTSVECRDITIRDRTLRTTISMGIAAIANGTSVTDPSALLRKADAVLYAAKRAGRNQTASADPGTGKGNSRAG
jgi:diguanylate cyclase (GGDEF)-like protein